jgi:hypothetical protein
MFKKILVSGMKTPQLSQDSTFFLKTVSVVTVSDRLCYAQKNVCAKTAKTSKRQSVL